ncbi:MAG TPA: hypothetical protein VFH51_05670, partial [Myxococcota bacterium]|nr:hypothetical protein [Myxococcota bacterium]
INIGTAKATNVAIGINHTIALMSDGTVRTWGAASQDNKGSCPDNGTVCNPSTFTDIIGVAAGFDTSCVLRQGGTVWCVGNNNEKELGNGSTAYSSTSFVQVKTASSTYLTGVVQITASYTGVCALVSGGKVYCWGTGATGQVGATATSSSSYANTVKTSSGAVLTGINHLDGGYYADGSNTIGMCARDLDGDAMCWGDSYHGNLDLSFTGHTYYATPKQVTAVSCQ